MKALVLVALMVASADASSIDWARGLVSAEGVGLADRHAPNPAVARGTSRRDAEAAARKELTRLVATLPIAGGGTVADAKKDKAIAARIERAIEHAITVAAEPETDGAWRVTLAVPIEAVRQAIVGPRVLGAGATDTGPAVVVVEGTNAKPVLGVTFAGIEAAALWIDGKDLPAWAKDAPRVKGSAPKKGAVASPGSAGARSAANGSAVSIELSGITPSPATLFVVITGS